MKFEFYGENMKIWIDDIRPAPPGYTWIKNVNSAKEWITIFETRANGLKELISKNPNSKIVIPTIEVVDIDHDAGEYASDGGDYIKLLDWLEETNRNYPIRIHSMNPVGIENMRRIIQKNGWKEIK